MFRQQEEEKERLSHRDERKRSHSRNERELRGARIRKRRKGHERGTQTPRLSEVMSETMSEHVRLHCSDTELGVWAGPQEQSQPSALIPVHNLQKELLFYHKQQHIL